MTDYETPLWQPIHKVGDGVRYQQLLPCADQIRLAANMFAINEILQLNNRLRSAGGNSQSFLFCCIVLEKSFMANGILC